MRIQINLSDKHKAMENADLCRCIGYNVDKLISEYREWESSNNRKTTKFEKKSFWFLSPDLKFRIKCNGKTMYITEIEKSKGSGD